jgi:hypothetical protein
MYCINMENVFQNCATSFLGVGTPETLGNSIDNLTIEGIYD